MSSTTSPAPAEEVQASESRATETSTAEAVVRAAFEAYEDALQRNDVDTMNEYFWDSDEVVRFGIAEEQWGTGELRRWRAGAAPVPPGRSLSRTRVTVIGADTAIVTTLFSYPQRPGYGRQSQTWYRFAAGWRIVAAHVSEILDRPSVGKLPDVSAQMHTG